MYSWVDTSAPPTWHFDELVGLMQQATYQAYESEGLVYKSEEFDLNGKLDMAQPVSFKVSARSILSVGTLD